MDLLVEKMHYTRFNAINKPEIILARKGSCMLDNYVRESTKIGSGHLFAFFILFWIYLNQKINGSVKRKKRFREKKTLRAGSERTQAAPCWAGPDRPRGHRSVARVRRQAGPGRQRRGRPKGYGMRSAVGSKLDQRPSIISYLRPRLTESKP
jgi:hypothetical protein